MDIEKAIELLKIASMGWPAGGENINDYYTALQLGIEALQRIKRQRQMSVRARRYLLPAETPGKSTNQ